MDALEFASGGNFLKKEDVPNPQDVTIQGVKKVEVDDQARLAVKFQQFEKALLANKTNSRFLVERFGRQTDGWSGKAAVLFTDGSIEFGGQRVGGLRLRDATPSETTTNDNSGPKW